MSDNPFQSPHVEQTQNIGGAQPVGRKAPVSITVFGVLNIVFGVIGICGSIFAVIGLFVESMELPNQPENPVAELMNQHPIFGPYQKISVGLGSLVTIVLLVAGVMLLMKRKMGLTLSNVYGIYTILMTLVGVVMFTVVLRPELLAIPDEGGMPFGAIAFWSGLVGGLVGMIYPVLLLIFMNRPVVKDALL